MSRNQRLAFAAIAAVIAVVAVIVLASGGNDSSSTTPAATSTADAAGTPPSQQPAEASPAEAQIQVKGGDVVGGVQEIRVKKGEHIRFSVTSDKADEVHVHGYDVKKDVTPGEPVQ